MGEVGVGVGGGRGRRVLSFQRTTTKPETIFDEQVMSVSLRAERSVGRKRVRRVRTGKGGFVESKFGGEERWRSMVGERGSAVAERR